MRANEREMNFITAPDGVRLAIEEGGNRAGVPLVFVHGFSHSSAVWDRQFAGDLARAHRLVRFDLRGHGESDKPPGPRNYTESQPWANDLRAVIEGRRLDRPILVAWSYAGYVVCDYLRAYGADGIRGLVLVAGATKKGVPDARPFNGRAAAPLWKAMFDDAPEVWEPALTAFCEACTAAPLAPAFQARILEHNARTPSSVRRAMMERTLDNDDVLRGYRQPGLIVHGSEDGIVTPLAAEHHARLLPQAKLAIYEGVGHMPFAELPARFDRDLAAFAASTGAGTVFTGVLNQ